MKTRLFVRSLLAGTLLLISNLNYGQAPPLGTTADFVLYTSVGAMVNVGTYQYLTLLTGNVGTNSGPITNFGNVNGVMHTGDGATTSADADLIIARDFLVAAIHDSAIVNPVLGKDSTYMAGTYLLPNEAVSLNLSLTLDAQGDPNAVFIFKMAAIAPVYAFSTSANAKVKLINGAQACNVYWYISGAVSMAAGTSMKGTIISGGAIDMAAGDTLEGRALTTAGGVTVDNGDIGFLGYLPVDISTPLPTGPAAPVFVESKEYAIFSSIGNVTDDGTSHVDGSVGGNSALPTGFNPLFVTGNIDGMNPATAGAAADLLLVYNSLNTLTADIELLAPPQFGHNLVLTPNTYLMNGAVTFTDTVFMDGFGNPDAVFIIKTYGAFASGVNSRVVLMNGTQAKNVYWMVNGAVSIGDGSIFNGNIIANNGAIDLLTGATLNGRALTTDGAISVTAMNAILPYPPFVITDPVGLTVCEGDSAGFTVEATGSGTFTYQWRKGTVNLIDGGNISGVTNDTLIIDPVSTSDAASNYNVIVYGSIEPNDTSVNATLVVNTSPAITTQPANQIECAGDPASFSVVATGAGLTYQWRKGIVNLVDGITVTGATTATLTLDPIVALDAAANYNVVITGSCTPPVTSANASLTVNSAPAITTQSTNQIECAGSPASFSVVATGTSLTYQWRKGLVNLTNGGNVTGATTATLTLDPVALVDAAVDYNVVITGTCLPAVTSANASLTVNPVLPAGVSVAADANPVCTATTVAFTATPTNGGATPVYQWYKNTIAVGTNSAIYTYVPVTGDAVYVIMTSSLTCTSGSPATSNTVTMTVNSDLPAGVSVVADANPVCTATTVAFTATPTNGGAIPVYQWYKNTVAVGTNSATYTYVPVTGDAVYVIMTSSLTCTTGSPATSNTVTMVVNSDLPAGVSVTADANPVCTATTVAFTATPTNGGATPVYQWYKNTVAVGTNSATYTYVPVTGDAVYVIMTSSLTCTSGSPATSNTVTMVVNSDLPAGVSVAADANPVCTATTVAFTATPTNGGAIPVYQWYKNTIAVGTNSATYTYVPVTGDAVYVI
ncbi:MAG: ice-binding family protein, partial [Salinivirgaceae bacterium]